ncbi:nck-associated protein 5 isoform X2 [Ambystoma mexicanum]|uniref:nck-associated protein 5 isoform X2 n=1 Tax=Ambystoma mexicanum TaxID=8296 RepID=UPI0037E950CF
MNSLTPYHVPADARETLAVARPQREVTRTRSEATMREKLIHELEEERHLRLECERRLREATLESDRSRAQMLDLQQQFSRMEETVRNLLRGQGALEQNGLEAVNIMKVYQEKMPEEERKRKASAAEKHSPDNVDSRSEFGNLEEEKEKTRLLLERLKTLEAENSALALENENQRAQYERCLDEVANQVVQALLTQKDLREECLKLKTRVVDLEEQNQSLNVLFQQRVRPASDKLLQKLHSRILDLSSVDLLTEVERNRSMRQLRSEFQSHECQQHVRSGVPTIKCHSQLHKTGPSRLYPRSSCSSSEISLSSACSEFSSGSSCTWNDGKTCSKLSSVSWDKRINMASSVPSSLSSPGEDLPPTRIKECHILEGLKKLQRRKGFLEPHSLVSKWGDKDCMDSNEGIYSPGIKTSSHNEPSARAPKDITGICAVHKRTFAYDSDSHDDADDESSTLALLHKGPNKDCRLHCNKLSHSISDSLFGWEPNGKHLLERGSFFHSKDRPEKLTRFVNDVPSEVKLCTRTSLPILVLEQSGANMDLNLQLSDTDDNEVLDDLHIESSDEKSPWNALLTPASVTHTPNTDMAAAKEVSQIASASKERRQGPEVNPLTCNVIKQKKLIKKTSSQECITVIFDAEDGEPIEFCSHQTGVVTVTTNEISLSQQPPIASAEYTELLPHLVNSLRNDSETLRYTVLQTPDGTENKTHAGTISNSIAVSATVSETVGPGRTMLPGPQQQQVVSPSYSISCKTSQSISFVPAGSHQSQTKSPSKGTRVPQVPKVTDKGFTNVDPVLISAMPERSPSSPPVKLSRFIKVHCPPCNLEPNCDQTISKHSKSVSPESTHSGQTNWTTDKNSNASESPLYPHPALQPIDYGEPPTRDKNVEIGAPGTQIHSPPAPQVTREQLPPPSQETRIQSLPAPHESKVQMTRVQSPPPPPPGRSVSLLIRPHYMHLSPACPKPVANIPSDVAKAAPTFSHFKGAANQGPCPNDKQSKKTPEFVRSESVHLTTKTTAPDKCTPQQSQRPHGICQAPSKVLATKTSSRTVHQPVRSISQDVSDSGSRTNKGSPSNSVPLEVSCPQIICSNKRGNVSDNVVPHLDKSPCSLPTSAHCHAPRTSEFAKSQVPNSTLSSSSSYNSEINIHQNSHGKILKTRVPVGMKVLVKSPQLLRKSCTVPGKQEKDSINAASRGGVMSGKSKQQELSFAAVNERLSGEPETDKADAHRRQALNFGKLIESPSPHSLEKNSPLADITDGIEPFMVKRSNSSNAKSHLKPALGMNGAKARSQSFSVNIVDKSPTPVCEPPGKLRTHIITNTADRGNSLTRQNSLIEGVPNRTALESSSPSSVVHEHPYCRQGSHVSGSQHGSPSKLPCRTPPKPDQFHGTVKSEGIKSPCWKEALSPTEGGKLCINKLKLFQMEPSAMQGKPDVASCPTRSDTDHKVHNTEHVQSMTAVDLKTPQTEKVMTKCSKDNHAPSIAVTQPTIEEKVMLGIQENVQKGQVQVKCPAPESKQKTVPSIASWFGFRRSKLPSLGAKKPDAVKAKLETKETRSGTGNKLTKVEKKKDKMKCDPKCSVDNKFNRKAEISDTERALKSDKSKRTSQDLSSPLRGEHHTDTITTTCSAKDIFMKELLIRSVSKGSSQGSSLPGNSISTQGNHKKSSKTKADMEIQKESLTHVIADSVCNDGDDTFTDSGCQNHTIESSCLMRTLDSGIGTFPLPDSGNRATGRYPSKQESPIAHEVLTLPELDSLTAAAIKAKTLEREVPLADGSHVPDESSISHSLSDPTMTAKCVQPFLSRLPKPSTSGMCVLDRHSKPQLTPIISSCSEHSDKSSEILMDGQEWGGFKPTQMQDPTLRVCTYSASSSDTDRELELETNAFGTEGAKLLNIMENNKQAEQVNSVRTSFIGTTMSIMDLYQKNIFAKYEEDAEHVPHFDFLQQFCGATCKDHLKKEKSSKLKPADESKEDPACPLSQISLESFNKFNRSSLVLLEKEKSGLNEVEEQKEESGRDEAVSLSCSDRAGPDNLESLSDSLYDSFSSCASQGSNDV